MRSDVAKTGDVIAIDVRNIYRFYAQVLNKPLYRFFNNTDMDAKIDRIISSEEIFKVWVVDDAIKRPNWHIVGNVTLEKDALSSPWFHRKDKLSGTIYKYRSRPDLNAGYEELECSLEEANKLEAAAVWSGDHIEERLQDWLAGKENRWTKLLRLT